MDIVRTRLSHKHWAFLSMLSVALATNPLLAFGLDNSKMVVDQTNGKRIGFASALNNLIKIRSEINSSRADFENLDTYERRIASAVTRLDKYTTRQFLDDSQFDDVRLDWENSRIILTKQAAVQIIRKRGMSQASNSLRVAVTVAPDLAREISSFPMECHYKAMFHFSRSGDIVLDQLQVFYGQRIIYEE